MNQDGIKIPDEKLIGQCGDVCEMWELFIDSIITLPCSMSWVWNWKSDSIPYFNIHSLIHACCFVKQFW